MTVDGSQHELSGCTVQYAGCGALSIGGGDTATLEPSSNRVVGNIITQYARRKRTYQPAIGWHGVGGIVANNTMSNAPHCGILGGGNDYLYVLSQH